MTVTQEPHAATGDDQAVVRPLRPGPGHVEVQKKLRRVRQAWTWFSANLPYIFVGFITLGAFGYGASESYDSLYHLALRQGTYVSLPHVLPIGFEGVLVAVVATDIVFTAKQHPVWFLSWAARLFVAFSIVGNALAGWPDLAAVFLHLPAPVVVAVVVEATRVVLLRKMKANQLADKAPFARWLLSPVPTFFRWRRKIMWYPRMSWQQFETLEIDRMKAREKLRMHYKLLDQDWRKVAPADIRRWLRRGVNLEETCARVDALTGSGERPRDTSGKRAGSTLGETRGERLAGVPGSGAGAHSGSVAGERRGPSARERHDASVAAGDKRSYETWIYDEALGAAKDHQREHGGMIGVTRLERHLGVRNGSLGGPDGVHARVKSAMVKAGLL